MIRSISLLGYEKQGKKILPNIKSNKRNHFLNRIVYKICYWWWIYSQLIYGVNKVQRLKCAWSIKTYLALPVVITETLSAYRGLNLPLLWKHCGC